MSKSTVASLSVDVAALAETVRELAQTVAAMQAVTVEPKAKTVRKAPAKKAPAKKAPAKKAAAKKAAPKTARALCKATRKDFVAAAAKAGTDFAGMSTQTIAGLCLEDERLIPAGFVIGEGYRALFA